MIAPPPIVDLDDAGSLEAADTPGTLRSAATGGALVRAVAEAVREGALTRLDGVRPRSVLFVTGSGRARRAVSLVAAAIGARLGLPIIQVTALPLWTGPLDVVVVGGDDAGEPRLAEAVDRAVRRGAEVVVTAPDEGPLRVAAGGRAVLLPPRVPVAGHNTLLHYLAATLAVLRVVDPLHTQTLIPDLEALADALDAEAMIGHPRNEVFHNPAKSLAARMQGHSPVFVGDTPVTTELARHAGELLLRLAGRSVAAVELADAAVADFGPAVGAMPGYDPLFHDEQLDGPAPRDQVRAFVLSTDPDRRAVQRRMATLPDADLLTATVEGSEPAGELEQLAVLVLRLELAAAYVKLVGGAATEAML